MKIGTYYYPEQWPQEQWERDFDHIEAMGLQIVHMGEFAWHSLEPPSNPGSADLQDVKTEDGRTFSELLADHLKPIAAREGLVGDRGWSSLGAVVGATQQHTMQSLRQRLPQSIFLLPGYGTQGATADMTRAAFRDGQGAIVSASRSILYAHRDPQHAGKNWKDAVSAAVNEMKRDVASIL